MITIRSFNVTDVDTGSITKNGTTFISSGENAFLDNFNTITNVEGTPDHIDNTSISSIAHLEVTYIKIKEFMSSTSEDCIFIPDSIKIKRVGGTSELNNSLIYAFSNNSDQSAVSVIWKVGIPNTSNFSDGSYITINFPDLTYYPNDLYLMLAIAPDAWTSKNIVNATTCTISGNFYYTINPTYSLSDIGLSHSIVTVGYNSQLGVFDRCVIAFEDTPFTEGSTRTYDSLIISVSSTFLDDINTTETRLDATVVCMLENTHVLTPDGYRLIQNLKIGDFIIKGNGMTRTIIKDIKRNIFPSIGEYYPYKIPKNYFSEGRPLNDLYLSKHHLLTDLSPLEIGKESVFKAGTMKTYKYFGLKIEAIPSPIIYYHVELENAYDTLIAEDIIIESWVKNSHPLIT